MTREDGDIGILIYYVCCCGHFSTETYGRRQLGSPRGGIGKASINLHFCQTKLLDVGHVRLRKRKNMH